MSRIEKLTAEQTAKMAEYRDKWVAIGLSTEPANRKEAEAGIIAAYAAGGLKAPKIVWCGSPLSQGLTRAIILDEKFSKLLRASPGKSVRDSVGDSVRASVRDSVGASVWDSVGASVRDSVGDSVRASVRASVGASVRDSVGDSVRASVRASVWDSVGASVRDSVRASVWASVWDSVRASVRASVWASVRASVWASVGASVGDSVGASVWASVRASVWDSVGDSVWDSVGASGYGQHDANWLAFYEYFREICGLTEQTEKIQGLTRYSKNAGWFIPHKHICWVSERHNLLQRDARGQLHSLTGPAVMYPDGWAIYAVHGVRIPADIIEKPESVTVERIEKEENAEVRRVMVERMGYERYILESGAKLIHSDETGALYRKEFQHDEPLVVVHVVNATPEPDGSLKKYTLRVPPTINRAREAVAWTFGMKESEYSPAIET